MKFFDEINIENWGSPWKMKRATTWQNQKSDCAPSEDSDQPWHPPSLIRVFAVHLMGSGCPGWSESSLGTHSFCWFLLWGGSKDQDNDGNRGPRHEKTILCHMRTTKTQISTLISAFIVCCLDSLIPIVAISDFSVLANFCSWACWFESYLVANLWTGFLVIWLP